MMQTPETRLYRSDIDDAFFDRCRRHGTVGWDIETSGLDWRVDDIATCQVAAGDAVALVQIDRQIRPDRLVHLLQDKSVTKVFHHAPFDLRFMTFRWGATATAIACTKIASKILDPTLEQRLHSLQPTLARRLGIHIDKGEQVSNWLADELSTAQVQYAADDVRHLVPLLACELDEAAANGLGGLIDSSFRYIPTRIALDILGAGDVFDY